MRRTFHIQVTLPKKVADVYSDRVICSILQSKMKGLNSAIRVEQYTPQEETGLGDVYVRTEGGWGKASEPDEPKST